jgi:tetratricopeptide (TPR) repeat protein
MSQAGPHKLNFCKRLGQTHYDLADYLDIRSTDRARWEQGRECWGILEWLEDRERLPELQEALIAIDRKDLVEIVQAILAPGDMDIRGTVSYAPDPDGLLSGIAQREAANSDSTILSDERHRRIDQVHTFINQGQFNQAAQYLEALKQELWLRTDDKLKYRLLVNLGMARLGMDEINDAATCFLEALQYNPTDDKAITYAAMSYLFQKDNANANKLIEEALQKNPANALAYSLRIRTTSITETIESALEQIPSAYHTTPDVLVALGEAALNRKLYGEAVEYWEAALSSSKDRSMDSVKAFLGIALIEPISENHVLIAAGQVLDSEKHRLEQAVALFTEVLGGTYINPNDLSHTQFTALANRSAALRLLGRYDEAIRDIDIARQKEPEDSSLIKQRVLLAHDKGNEEEAYRYAQEILSSPKTPEASLLAVSSLMTLSRFEEAEYILNEFLQKDSPKYLKFQAKQIKFDLFLERNDRQRAEKILQEVNDEEPESVFTFILNIRWKKYINSQECIPVLVEQAKVALNLETFLGSKIILADFLYSLNYYRDAAEVYEKFVNKSLNTPISRRLLEAYYLSGNYKDALDLCQRILDKYGPLRITSEIAAHIYDDIGDLNNARKVCEDYIDLFPDDLAMQLRLAAIHYAKGEYENLDNFLDSISIIETLSLAFLKKLAQLSR